jgi:integrase
MRGKIRHRGQRWYVSIVGDDGAEHAHGGFRTKSEARAKLTELLGGPYVAPDTLTVDGYLTRWLATRDAADISPGTRDLERLMVRVYISPHIGAVPLQSLGTEHLSTLYATLSRSGGRGGRPLRGKSVRNVHGLLSKALGDARRWKPRPLLAVNPVGEPPARDDSVERQAWTAEEVRRFLMVASEDRLAGVWRLALATGLRRGELLGLWWDDLDLEAREVRVQRQVLAPVTAPEVGRRLYIRETTKSRKARLVRFDEGTATALKAWKAAQGRERLAFGPAWRAMGGLGVQAPWVVTEPDGFVIHPDTLLRRWKALVKRVGVTPIPLHGARHSYATLALGAGVRLDIVSRQLGHASIGTTANIYGHDDRETALDAAEKVASVYDAAP